MRIIGGEFGGRVFKPKMKNWPTRPTTDFAKEALFNVLQNKINFEESIVCDLFGGTGSITLECLSRGSRQVTYVDQYYPCVAFIKSILAEINRTSDVNIIKSDVTKFIQKNTTVFDIIFADPPYESQIVESLPDLIFSNNMLHKDGILVIEHSKKNKFENHPHFNQSKNYGGCVFSFFS